MTELDGFSIPEILNRMLSKEYFLIEYRLVTSSENLHEKLRDHLIYMIKLEKAGVLFLSGPLYDQSGAMTGEGITVVRAASFQEADEIARQEPFVLAGLREAKIRRWVINEGRISLQADLSDRCVALD